MREKLESTRADLAGLHNEKRNIKKDVAGLSGSKEELEAASLRRCATLGDAAG